MSYKSTFGRFVLDNSSSESTNLASLGSPDHSDYDSRLNELGAGSLKMCDRFLPCLVLLSTHTIYLCFILHAGQSIPMFFSSNQGKIAPDWSAFQNPFETNNIFNIESPIFLHWKTNLFNDKNELKDKVKNCFWLSGFKSQLLCNICRICSIYIARSQKKVFVELCPYIGKQCNCCVAAESLSFVINVKHLFRLHNTTLAISYSRNFKIESFLDEI